MRTKYPFEELKKTGGWYRDKVSNAPQVCWNEETKAYNIYTCYKGRYLPEIDCGDNPAHVWYWLEGYHKMAGPSEREIVPILQVR